MSSPVSSPPPAGGTTHLHESDSDDDLSPAASPVPSPKREVDSDDDLSEAASESDDEVIRKKPKRVERSGSASDEEKKELGSEDEKDLFGESEDEVEAVYKSALEVEVPRQRNPIGLDGKVSRAVSRYG